LSDTFDGRLFSWQVVKTVGNPGTPGRRRAPART